MNTYVTPEGYGRPALRGKAPGGSRLVAALPYAGLVAFAFAATSYLVRLQQPGMLLGLLGLGLGVVLHKRIPDWGGALGLSVAAFIFAVGLSVPSSIWLGPSIEEAIEFAKLLVVFIVAINALNTRKRLWQFAAFIVIMMTLFPALGGLRNYLTGMVDEPGRADWEGYYGNANHLAMTLLMQVPIAAALLQRQRKKSRKLFWLAMLAILLVVSVLTKSRAGFLSMGFLAVLMIAASRHKVRMIGLIGVTCMVGWFMAPQDFRDRMGTIFTAGSQRDQSATSRTIIWGVALKVGLSRPFTGVGVGTYEQANARVAPWSLGDSGGDRWLDTHNTYLNVWAETGGIGLITFLVMLGLVFREGGRAIRVTPRSDPLRALVKGGLIGVCVFCAMGVFNTLHDAWFLYTLFAVVANGSRLLVQRYGAAPQPSFQPVVTTAGAWEPQVVMAAHGHGGPPQVPMPQARRPW